ncbi:MAG: FAD-dependent oxidoreductase, partial [bacterium]
MSRVGVFLYRSEEIANAILVDEVLSTLEKEIVEVVATGSHSELLSRAGLEYIKEQIETHNLDRVVIGAESPERYEKAFQKMAEEARLNPYHLKMVNLRDEVCLVHRDKVEEASLKAVDVLRKAVKSLKMMENLPRRYVRVEQRVLIIGGGVTGINAALCAANAGLGVILVEKAPTLGGQTLLHSRIYPKMEDSEDEIVPKMLELSERTDVRILDYSEVVKVSGFLGNFDVVIKRKPRMVNPEIPADWKKGIDACPVEVPDEYQAGMKKRKAFYIPYPTAVPRYPLIDPQSCVRFRGEDCRLCQQALPLGAVDYEQKEEIITERVGAIFVCTGMTTFIPRAFTQYRYGVELDVVLPFQMEQMLKEWKATRKITRPS